MIRRASTTPPKTDLEDLRARFRGAGLSLTHQRMVIYRAVREMRNHPSPESIYEEVRRRIPAISLGTVYRNIKTFMDAGLLREVSLHHGTLRVETHLGGHHHLVCRRCKAIVELAAADLEPPHLKRRLPAGFQVERCNVEFHDVCAACLKQSKTS